MTDLARRDLLAAAVAAFGLAVVHRRRDDCSNA
jgi:hypothetical protein